MRPRRIRHLFAGEAPGPERIFWTAFWFKTHNNARYAELVPRLERLDAYFITGARARVPLGVQFRLYRNAPGALTQSLLLRQVERRYRTMFCTEFRQIAHFPGPVVVDVDDPYFEEPELSLFRRPNVAALVTMADWAAERFRSLGVTAPIHVIPQGVNPVPVGGGFLFESGRWGIAQKVLIF